MLVYISTLHKNLLLRWCNG